MMVNHFALLLSGLPQCMPGQGRGSLDGHIQPQHLFPQDLLRGGRGLAPLDPAADGQHLQVRLSQRFCTLAELLHDVDLVRHLLLIFQLMLQTGPVVLGGGADLYR